MSDVAEPTVDDEPEKEDVDTEPEAEPEIPKVPDPADVVRVAAPSDELGKSIFEAQAKQARQALAQADVDVAASQARVDDPATTYDETDHEAHVQRRKEAKQILDVIVAATGASERDVERDTIQGVANLIAEHQGFVAQGKQTLRQHELMVDSPEAFGHNHLDVAWVEENEKAAESWRSSIVFREGLIAQLQAQAEQLKADETARKAAKAAAKRAKE